MEEDFLPFWCHSLRGAHFWRLWSHKSSRLPWPAACAVQAACSPRSKLYYPTAAAPQAGPVVERLAERITGGDAGIFTAQQAFIYTR